MSKPLIFSLRPEPDCHEDIDYLRGLDIQALALPMLSIKVDDNAFLAAIEDAIHTPQAQLIITSKQAARMLIARPALAAHIQNRRIWCVGGGTADRLRRAGFTQVMAGTGDARGLLGMIMGRQAGDFVEADLSQPDGQYLWLSGADIAVDMQSGLADYAGAVTRHIIYKAEANYPDSQPLMAASIAGHRVAVAAMSARTITLFSDWLMREGLQSYLPDLTLILSGPAQVKMAKELGFSCVCAADPSREAMLACMADWAKNPIAGA